ncbi:restriction endonuclease subunit S [uncultured Gemmiger sp.]|uniref:restriction endonuclease subunit S n=1 Tax=uncultured Gemmiger sp. TaxID=1623490 RepID=UPI00266C0956|nr:restriction endonuclease subunit S [uncultured Gemmiger sp.]
MREMKDSGIEWIGLTPSMWANRRIKYVIKSRDSGLWGQDVKCEENGTICLRIADFDYSKGIFKDTPVDALTYRKYPSYVVDKCHLKKGDILIEKSGGGEKTPVGRTVLFDKPYIALFANFMDRIRVNTSVVMPQYLQYWFRAFYSCKMSPYYINQTTGIQNINLSRLLTKEKVFYPSLKDQKAIVSFLDIKCSEIDAISADIQKEIETLEQYKRSVITEAVTKGLNPDVEMKDSGAEWIGRVPNNWNLGRIGGFYSLRNEKVSDKDYPPLSVTMKGILPQLETAAKTNDGDNRKLVRKGDFAINSRSDRRGSCGISKYDGSVSLINTVLTPRGKMSAAYYDWVFHCTRFSDEFYRQGHGIVDDLWTTGWQEMKKIIIPVPPFLEQNEIADYLSSKCSDIDSVISQKNQQLETLSNYKKILIYEYVTGKKEVLI